MLIMLIMMMMMLMMLMMMPGECRERNKAVSSYYNQHSIDVAAAKVPRIFLNHSYIFVFCSTCQPPNIIKLIK